MRRKIWYDGWKRKYFELWWGSEQGPSVEGREARLALAWRGATGPGPEAAPAMPHHEAWGGAVRRGAALRQ
jgi:hypothetical protein